MTYLCSGEMFDYAISAEECLECSLKSAPCGYSYPLLKAIFLSQQDRSREIHITDLTTCLRRAYHNKVNVFPVYVHELLKMFLGSAIHDYIEKYNDPEDAEVKLKTGDVLGTMDYVKDGHLIDYKTSRWMIVSKLPYGSHVQQINYYAAYREDIKKASIQYIDLSGPSTCRKCRVDMRLINGTVSCPKCGYIGNHLGAYQYDVELQERDINLLEVNDRVNQLRHALDTSIEPSPEPSYLCRFNCPALGCELRE